jgi:hypothetical protein
LSRAIKITTIDQAEEHIDRQQRQLRNLENKLQNVQAEARQEVKRISEKKANELKQALNYQIQGLEQDMADMEINHRSVMKRQADDFYQNIDQLQDWTENMLGDLENRVNESFEKQHQQIDNVRQSVNRLYQIEDDEKKRAELIVKDLRILINAVNEKTNHNKYAPGKLNQLQNRFQNFNNGNLPSASVIALAQSLTNDLWELEEEILKNQLRFEAMHNFVLKEATELLQIMSKNRNEIYFTDETGEKIKDENNNDIKVEIDYWTQGKYVELEKQATELKTELETLRDKPEQTEERLKQILSDVAILKEDQNRLVKLALQRGIASEQRIAISEDIINAMLQQGFELKTLNNGDPAHNYMGGETESDQREGVFAVLRNGNETEISIIIHPDETLTKNHIVFQRNDDSSLNEGELRRSINEIKGIIEKQGYNMGDVGSPTGTGDNTQYELADANALAKVGIKKELKERLGFSKKQLTQK